MILRTNWDAREELFDLQENITSQIDQDVDVNILIEDKRSEPVSLDRTS